MSHARFVSGLSEEERQQLEKVWRSGRSHRVRERAHAVLLSAKGYTLDQIADVLEVDRDAVSRTLDRWERGGVAALEEGPRSGRHPKVDAALEAAVLASAAEQPASLRRTLAKGGAAFRQLRHAREGLAPGALALAAHAPAHRVAAARKALSKLRAHEQAGRCDLFSGVNVTPSTS